MFKFASILLKIYVTMISGVYIEHIECSWNIIMILIACWLIFGRQWCRTFYIAWNLTLKLATGFYLPTLRSGLIWSLGVHRPALSLFGPSASRRSLDVQSAPWTLKEALIQTETLVRFEFCYPHTNEWNWDGYEIF